MTKRRRTLRERANSAAAQSFKEVEPLELDDRRTISIERLEDGTQYVDLSNEREKQYFYLMRDEAGALLMWLTRAIGFQPVEATPFVKFSEDRKKIITIGITWTPYEARALRDWLNRALGDQVILSGGEHLDPPA